MELSSQEYQSELPCLPPGDLPDPGIEPASLVSPALEGGFFTTSTTWEAPKGILLLLLLLSRFSRVRLCATPETAAHQAPPSLDSPGKNTGVGCHFLLQCMKVKSENEVSQLSPTLSDTKDCNLPGYC